MSHFTKVKTKIYDREILEQVLKSLNYRVSPIKKVIGWRNITHDVDFGIKIDNHYSIGFKQADSGTYEVVADWWVITNTTGLKEKDFLNQINQIYSYKKVLSEVKKQGFMVSEEKVQPDKSIRLVVRKW